MQRLPEETLKTLKTGGMMQPEAQRSTLGYPHMKTKQFPWTIPNMHTCKPHF